MIKILSASLLLAGTAISALAQSTAPAPEIDGGTAGTAIALLSGAIMIVRARRK